VLRAGRRNEKQERRQRPMPLSVPTSEGRHQLWGGRTPGPRPTPTSAFRGWKGLISLQRAGPGGPARTLGVRPTIDAGSLFREN
jgi:hypothetical protein